MKLDLKLMKNVFEPLTKSSLMPFGLTATASAGDTGIYKNVLELDQ